MRARQPARSRPPLQPPAPETSFWTWFISPDHGADRGSLRPSPQHAAGHSRPHVTSRPGSPSDCDPRQRSESGGTRGRGPGSLSRYTARKLGTLPAGEAKASWQKGAPGSGQELVKGSFMGALSPCASNACGRVQGAVRRRICVIPELYKRAPGNWPTGRLQIRHLRVRCGWGEARLTTRWPRLAEAGFAQPRPCATGSAWIGRSQCASHRRSCVHTGRPRPGRPGGTGPHMTVL